MYHFTYHTTMYVLLSNSYCTPVSPAEPLFYRRSPERQKGKILCSTSGLFYPQDLLPPKAAYTGCPICSTKLIGVLLILSGFAMSIAKCAWNNFFSFSFFFFSLQRAAWGVEVWYRQTWSSSLDSTADLLCDLGQVHFFFCLL